MTSVDDVLKLIGLTTVIIVVSVVLVAVLFYTYGVLVGVPHSTGPDGPTQDGLIKALNNYSYDLDLVKEQTQRLDMYYAAKTSTEMSRAEFQSWLGMIKGLTDEFIARENTAIAGGQAYLSYLSMDSDEYSRVVKNEATCREDIKKVKYTYNGNVYIYNQQYGSAYGEIAYMD
jgi:hypothetical protein